LPEELALKPIEPNFQQFEFKDFFFSVGPLKVFSSENDLSPPITCTLRKQSSEQNYGITLKGDQPVRVSHVEPGSFAHVCLSLSLSQNINIITNKKKLD
jgi:hypothetical protein